MGAEGNGRPVSLRRVGARQVPWWRPVLVDGALAVFLFATATPSWLRPGHTALLPIALATTLPLTLRRRYPVQVFAVVAGSAFLQWLVVTEPVRAHDLAVLVALYTVAAYAGRRWSNAALAVGLVGSVMAWESATAARAASVLGLIPPSASVVAVWLVGRNMRTRRRYLAELEERAVRLEREREALARAAVAEERARIAREMHDVVAHTVAVMVAQAEGASATLRQHPEQAEAALEVVSDAGRQALAELRRTLGVLRGDGWAAGTAPHPGLPDLDSLITAMRTSGLPVRLVREGAEAPVEPTLGLAVYRIVQESLTNTLKHSGPDTPTQVFFRHRPEAIEVEILDGGAARGGGPGGGQGARPATAPLPPGHGLSGMRERVALYAGQLSAGPTPTGGWRVHAVLPLTGAGT